jgi:hypothetical protein
VSKNLEREKTQLLRLRYHDSTSVDVAGLGRSPEINNIVVGFQRWFYIEAA